MYNNYTGASGMNYGGGLDMTQKKYDWGGMLGAGLSGLGGFFGGNKMGSAFDQYGNMINDAMGKEQQYYDQGLQYYQPYYDQGTAAFGKYGQAVDNMSNPTGFVNDIMGSYSQSPYAAFQMQEGERAANNAAAAGGQLGSPAEQMGLMKYAQGVTSADQQNYLDHVLGVNSQYLQGLQGQAGMGYGAAQNMDSNRRGLADNLTELLQNLGASGVNSQAAQSGGLGDLFGGIAGIASFF